MKRITLFCILSVLVGFMTSCDNGHEVTNKLDYIKEVGNRNPKEALLMLDSVKANEYLFSENLRMKCDLLDIRLHDKANITATSDIRIKRIVNYFDKHGDNEEKQEAHYYAGSVYRDLKNYPKALVGFQQAEDLCYDGETFDSLILRNTYSNLSWIYYQVQDYNKASVMSQKEYDLGRKMHILDAVTVQGLGASLLRNGDPQKAKKYFTEALDILKSGNSIDDDKTQTVYHLLYHFSYLKMKYQAESCYNIVKASINRNSISSENLYEIGEYYLMKDSMEAAIDCYKLILTRNNDLEIVYDASKKLFKLYNKLGDIKQADQYAQLFIKTSEALDLGKRQVMAANTNNLYQYHRDEKREEEIIERSAKYKSIALWTLSTLIPIIIIVILLYVYKKKKSEREIISQRKTISSYNEEIRRQKEEIEKQRCGLHENMTILEQTRNELQKVIDETERYKGMIDEQKVQLEEKIEENKDLIRLVHRTEFEESAEDVINTILQSSLGKHKMSVKEWNMLIQAVDKQHPEFSNLLASKLGRVDQKVLRMCYLLRIGLTNPQILNITGLPHSTVWRWAKKYEWIAKLNND